MLDLRLNITKMLQEKKKDTYYFLARLENTQLAKPFKNV
jgi:hypothetical protein